jgi:hypothetical protein
MLSLPVATSPQGLGEFDYTQPVPRGRVFDLSLEHDDLDCAIDALVAANTHDDLIVARLKKRKLQIRDEIAGIIAAAHTQAAPEAAIVQDGMEVDARSTDVDGEAAPAPRSGGGFAMGLFAALLVILVLALGWSDLTESLNQTVAQIYLLSLLAAANG